jgi:hypothetical protein
MNTRFKVFASYNILQYLCDFIPVLIFVIVSKCRKSPKLTNIVITTFTRGANYVMPRFWTEVVNVKAVVQLIPTVGDEGEATNIQK